MVVGAGGCAGWLATRLTSSTTGFFVVAACVSALGALKGSATGTAGVDVIACSNARTSGIGAFGKAKLRMSGVKALVRSNVSAGAMHSTAAVGVLIGSTDS